MEEFLNFLIENTEEAGSFSIEYNPHKAVHEAVERYVNDDCYDAFETPEKKAEAVKSNTLFILHWYQRTSVGFVVYTAPTLEDLVRWVMEDAA